MGTVSYRFWNNREKKGSKAELVICDKEDNQISVFEEVIEKNGWKSSDIIDASPDVEISIGIYFTYSEGVLIKEKKHSYKKSSYSMYYPTCYFQ